MPYRTLFVVFVFIAAGFAQADAQKESEPGWSLGGFQTMEFGDFQGNARLVKHFGDLVQFPHFGGPVTSTQAEFSITKRLGFGMGLSAAYVSGTGPVADQSTATMLQESGITNPEMNGTMAMRLTQINPHLLITLISRKTLRVDLEAGLNIAWLTHVYRGDITGTIPGGQGPVPISEGVYDKGRNFLPPSPRIGVMVERKVKGPFWAHGSASFNTFGVQELGGVSIKF
jgi:hypothetical protein